MKFHTRLTSVRVLCAALLLAAPWARADAPAHSHYLLVHFTEGVPDSEQIYFSTSTDGMRWTDVNNSRPVLSSAIGEKGLRDPAVVRSADGSKFWILATDLRMANNKGWDVAMHRGSTSIVVYESTDLVHWSAPRLVDLAGSIDQAGCAWAPEAIYDEEAGDYLVYWTTISPVDGIDKPRIYSARTRDFHSFTPATLYIDRPGKTGVIDTQIVRDHDPGARYRYLRASGDGEITIEGSNQLLGVWDKLGNLGAIGLTGKDVEGPILYRLPARGEWGLWVDQYRARGGYLALRTGDLSRPQTLRRAPAADVDYGASKKRHGSILNISAAEYRRVLARWPAGGAAAAVD